LLEVISRSSCRVD